MIIPVETLLSMDEFAGMGEQELLRREKAVELAVRAYTHNNFQNRNIRFKAVSDGYHLYGNYYFLRKGDTVQVSKSGVNDGLYTVTELSDDGIKIDTELFSTDFNLVTKVEYPADIVEGVLSLLKWQVEAEGKVGLVQSETLSRHSVTYVNLDTSNSFMGFPSSMLGFLAPYMKARF